MQELRLVAVSEDGTYLVLATAGRGTRFTLPVDDRLRAAVRGHFSRLGQFEIEVESPLRPKEIQARIRAGETAEEIAESAGIPVERVRWFEGPVLQEREYMAQQAQRVMVRRQGESSPGPPLGEMVEERLGRRGVDLEDIEWDSCKCEDNTWRVRLSFFDDGRPHAAEWVFDPRRRHISALDEEAARLSSLVLDESVTDTVTPLVPRRPAMKVVTEPRPGPGARPERALEPRHDGTGSGRDAGRDADPRRDYIVERGRFVENRPQPPAAQRESATLPPPYLRSEERERPAGPAARAGAGAGYAPLPPAREIAIPPIELDEPVRRPAEERSTPAADSRSARAGAPAAPVRSYAESPQEAQQAARPDGERTDAPRQDGGRAVTHEQVTAPAAGARADAEVEGARSLDEARSRTAGDSASAETAVPAEASAPVEAASDAAAVSEAETEASAAASTEATEATGTTPVTDAAETAESEAPAPAPAPAPQSSATGATDVAEAAPSTPGELSETTATAHTEEPEHRPDPVEQALPEPVPVPEPEPEPAPASGTAETEIEPEPVREPETEPAPEADAEPAAEARTETETETEAAADAEAPAADAEPKPVPKPPTRRPAAEPAVPAAPAGTAARGRSRQDRSRRAPVPERPAKPAPAEEPPAKPAAAAVNGDPAPGAPKPSPRGRRKGSARGKRASVPSWDEIMFGARRPD